MKTFKLILKTFFRTKFLSITTILFFIGISAYQIFIELAVPHLSGITMLSYYFQFSLVLFAVFMLLSYEFFIKIKKDKAQECLCAINNEATFISGLIACEEYNGIKYIYPYCSTSQLPEFGQGIKNESNNLINSPLWDKKIDTVIMIPFHPDFAVSRIPIYGNIMELKYLDRLRFQYDLFKIDSSKTELYESGYYLIIDDIKNFEKNVERNMDMYVGDLNSLVEKYGKEKVREELNKYIYDNANTSTPEEFLNSLRSETNA